MSILTYESDPARPCDVPKMKRSKLEDLAIVQMETMRKHWPKWAKWAAKDSRPYGPLHVVFAVEPYASGFGLWSQCGASDYQRQWQVVRDIKIPGPWRKSLRKIV